MICIICKIDKDFSEFYYRNDSGKYRASCKCCEKKRVNKYRLENIDIIKEKKKQYWIDNKNKLNTINKEKSAIYRKNNIEKVRISAKKWAKDNRNKQRDYTNNRYKNDIKFNLNIKLRRRLFMSLKRAKASKKNYTIKLLGCDLLFFKSYIESKFIDNMTWNDVLNGKIHIDHIIPCSYFNLEDEKEQEKCFNYKNLQPLWALDNLIKSNKILCI
jgi:hypothetical protein